MQLEQQKLCVRIKTKEGENGQENSGEKYYPNLKRGAFNTKWEWQDNGYHSNQRRSDVDIERFIIKWKKF